jgi:hypothetical protein
MTPLCELAVRHGTNKVDMGYTPFYYELLKAKRVKRVLEIGIGGPGLSGGASRHGASLYMWRDFFPEAEIYGFDVDRRLLFADHRIYTQWADVEHPTSLIAAAHMAGGTFDLIVDDAVHLPGPQLGAAVTLLPFLSKDGIYIIEDVANCDPLEIIQHIPLEYACWSVRWTQLPLIVIRPIK